MCVSVIDLCSKRDTKRLLTVVSFLELLERMEAVALLLLFFCFTLLLLLFSEFMRTGEVDMSNDILDSQCTGDFTPASLLCNHYGFIVGDNIIRLRGSIIDRLRWAKIYKLLYILLIVYNLFCIICYLFQ